MALWHCWVPSLPHLWPRCWPLPPGGLETPPHGQKWPHGGGLSVPTNGKNDEEGE